MKESKTGECAKCGKFFYIHAHHILPKAIFGNKGETVNLCPNCHTHFHEYRKKRIKDPANKIESEKIWTTWLKKVAVMVSISAVVFLLTHLLS